MRGSVMIVDDEREMCELLDVDLGGRGFRTTWYTSAEEAFSNLANEDIDVVLTDLQMPGMTGFDLCARIVANREDIPVVVVTAFGSMESAISALRAGAYDFTTKPIDFGVLEYVLDRAIRHRRLQRRVELLERASKRVSGFGELVGESPEMLRLYDQMDRLRETDTSILISGESGTGKELVARALHERSPRSSCPFLAINCAALPESLLESELFGHVRGAFTGAARERKGLIREADGGTLFFDEIGELPLNLQPKLLRVLEQRSVRPVGGSEERPFDVRILAATNRDLEVATQEGRFREDLFFRVNVVQLRVPPLRSRGTDVLLLAQRFLEEFAAKSAKSVVGFAKAVAERLVTYSWPGNVRELRNAIERAVALTRCDRIGVDDLPEKIRRYRPSHIVLGGEDPAELGPLEEVERRYIEHVLKATDGNKTEAARILGLDRKTLYRKLRRTDR